MFTLLSSIISFNEKEGLLVSVIYYEISGMCPPGYLEKIGDLPGWGTDLGRALNLTKDQCTQRCSLHDQCLSFEHSEYQMKCNLNKLAQPTLGPYKDFVFCTKNGNIASEIRKIFHDTVIISI